ncbi:hypothetical protein PSEWESI4_03215 [Pseudomonas carbonaria]|uniref:Uncharacterized protein n=1 Tax=Zestomonas carbonaria TaxID=2762745 RepID=A0A7U7EPQ2_9GAMM|nr:hypothetical protein PSEWESI4_03215 [Pseudomonas carbonaria]
MGFFRGRIASPGRGVSKQVPISEQADNFASTWGRNGYLLKR